MNTAYAFSSVGHPTYGCFQQLWYPQIIHFNRVFHYKPSILGYRYFWKHPYQYHPALFPGKKKRMRRKNDVPARQIHGLPEVNWDDHPVVVRTIILMATSQCSKPLFNALYPLVI